MWIIDGLIAFIMVLITALALPNYPGSSFYLIFFTIVTFGFIRFGIFVNKSFYQTFLVVFLTLGIWIKLMVHLMMNELSFPEGVGQFSFTKDEFDRVVIVCSVAYLGFMVAGLIFHKLRDVIDRKHPRINFIKNDFICSSKIISLWLLILLCLSLLNLKFGVYQRGSVGYDGPFLIRGFFAWGLTFGFYALTCILVYLDYPKNNDLWRNVILLFFTSLICSVSMLSRGFVLNAGSTLFVLYLLVIRQKIAIRSFVLIVLCFMGFTIASTEIVTKLRQTDFIPKNSVDSEYLSKFMTNNPTGNPFLGLFVDRWVGLEGVMRSVSFQDNRKEAFEEIWNEQPGSGTSYYDKVVMNSFYAKNIEKFNNKHTFINIPGFVSWIAILDQLLIVFIACIGISSIFLLIELMIFRYTNNFFLLSLLGQVMAYRVAHFGYLPKQTYLLLVTLMFTAVFAIFIERHSCFVLKSRSK